MSDDEFSKMLNKRFDELIERLENESPEELEEARKRIEKTYNIIVKKDKVKWSEE